VLVCHSIHHQPGLSRVGGQEDVISELEAVCCIGVDYGFPDYLQMDARVDLTSKAGSDIDLSGWSIAETTPHADTILGIA
jgi:hypothetical protein